MESDFKFFFLPPISRNNTVFFSRVECFYILFSSITCELGFTLNMWQGED